MNGIVILFIIEGLTKLTSITSLNSLLLNDSTVALCILLALCMRQILSADERRSLKFDSNDFCQFEVDKSTSICIALSKFILDLERLIISKPSSLKIFAVANPIPLLPPVIIRNFFKEPP